MQHFLAALTKPFCFSCRQIMETSSFLLVALLTLHMMPALATIKCYECDNTPEHPNPSSCNREHVKNIACDNPFLDRCMTITGTVRIPGNGSFDFEIKNCTSSFGCLVAVMGMCKLSNGTAGTISSCKSTAARVISAIQTTQLSISLVL